MTKREQVKFLQHLLDPRTGDLKKAGKKNEIVFDREEIKEIRRFWYEPDLPDDGSSVLEINPIYPDLPTIWNQPASQQF